MKTWWAYVSYQWSTARGQGGHLAQALVFYGAMVMITGLMLPDLSSRAGLIGVGLLTVFTQFFYMENYWQRLDEHGVIDAMVALPLSVGAQVMAHFLVAFVRSGLPFVGLGALLAWGVLPYQENMVGCWALYTLGLMVLSLLTLGLVFFLTTLVLWSPTRGKFLVLLLGLPFLTPLCLLTLGFTLPTPEPLTWTELVQKLGFLLGLGCVYLPSTLWGACQGLKRG